LEGQKYDASAPKGKYKYQEENTDIYSQHIKEQLPTIRNDCSATEDEIRVQIKSNKEQRKYSTYLLLVMPNIVLPA
jgi:hypothetical protein